MRIRAALVLATLGTSGFFVGSGVSQFLVPMALPVRLDLPSGHASEREARELAGGLFLPIEAPPPPPPPPAGDEQTCDLPWRLVGTMVDVHQADHSFAAFRTPDGSHLMMESMTRSDVTLVSMEHEAVVLERSGERCRLQMFTGTPAAPITPVSTPGPAPAAHPAVRRIDASHVEIDRSALDDLGALSRIRAIPHMDGGTIAGVRLYGIRRSHPLAAAGVRNGDLIEAVDGNPLTSPDVGLVALGRLRSGEPVRVTLVRDGQPQEVTVSSRP